MPLLLQGSREGKSRTGDRFSRRRISSAQAQAPFLLLLLLHGDIAAYPHRCPPVGQFCSDSVVPAKPSARRPRLSSQPKSRWSANRSPSTAPRSSRSHAQQSQAPSSRSLITIACALFESASAFLSDCNYEETALSFGIPAGIAS